MAALDANAAFSRKDSNILLKLADCKGGFAIIMDDKIAAASTGYAVSAVQLWLESIYHTYYPKVYNYLFYRLLDRDMADELTSIVFMRIVEKHHLYRAEKASIATWIFAIAKNELIDHYRRSKPMAVWDELAAGLSSGINIEEELIQAEEKQSFLVALKTLSERERNIVAMKYYFEMTYEDMANHTGLTSKNVSVILTRAKAKLRSLCLEGK